MGYNRTVGLSAGPRVAGGTASDCIWSIRIQNWSLRYLRPQHPAHRDGRTQVDFFG